MIKKSMVIKANRIKPIKFNYLSAVLFSLIFAGVIIGVSIGEKLCQSDNNLLSSVIDSFLSLNCKLSFVKLFSNYFLFAVSFVLIIYILGISAVGAPIICCITVIYGFICGAFIACLSCDNGILGFLFALLICLPYYAITAATLIKCCCKGLKMSVELLGAITCRSIQIKKDELNLKEYTIFFLLMCVPIIICSILKAILFTLFSGFFPFIG